VILLCFLCFCFCQHQYLKPCDCHNVCSLSFEFVVRVTRIFSFLCFYFWQKRIKLLIILGLFIFDLIQRHRYNNVYFKIYLIHCIFSIFFTLCQMYKKKVAILWLAQKLFLGLISKGKEVNSADGCGQEDPKLW